MGLSFLIRLRTTFSREAEYFIDRRVQHPQHGKHSSDDRTDLRQEMEERHMSTICFNHEWGDIKDKENSWQYCFSEL
jgi:hypothetical protein